MNILLNRPYMYSKIEKEDIEEMRHRRAQFLIYKTLKKADSVVSMRKNSYWFKVKFFKLKIKIGRRLKRLRKSILLLFSASKSGIYKQFICHLKYLKRKLEGKTGHGNLRV
ncbi:hypothetical protein K7X08_020016 [Anisodus acutangulus]|uniref:Uncharacterized protein n=1 Tax=Anisodus acutangulus TaxID=402998 RepID=A0A9Q1RMI9_9SOLA|nr:hypothetical protein K7X08_020016 [Anisodus acutangulus]